MNKNFKKLINNTLILSFGTICTKGLMFIMIPFFTHWLSQEDYGIYDLLITYTSLLIPVISFDLGEAVFRFLVEDENDHKRVISSSFKFILCIFLILIGPLFLILKNFLKVDVILCACALLFLEMFYIYFTMLLRGKKQLKDYSVANILFVVTMFLSVFILVKVLDLALVGILLGYSIGYLLSCLYMIIRSKFFKDFSITCFDASIIKKMLWYAIPLIPNAIAWWIMDASDRTIVTLKLGVTYSAIIAVAHKMPNICQTLYTVFHLSWQENAIDIVKMEPKEQNDYYNKVVNNMISILISISILVLSVNFIMFDYIFDSEYYEGYYHTSILVSSLILSMLAQFIGGIYIARRESKKNGFTTIISAIINIVFHLLLINSIGLYASSISTLIAYLSLFLIRYFDVRGEAFKLHLNKNNIINILIYAYFIATTFINNDILNLVNIVLAIFVFLFINKNILKKFMKVLTRKLSKG